MLKHLIKISGVPSRLNKTRSLSKNLNRSCRMDGVPESGKAIKTAESVVFFLSLIFIFCGCNFRRTAYQPMKILCLIIPLSEFFNRSYSS